ncbi:MAG: histidine phosphatase family protein [Chitinophagaceae bacterium]|nr:histidine phosphatase family protein [Chitinophagaceae bacterium]
MKTLLLIRHAKSSWDDISLSDEERPLNDRGKKNAPEMAKRLLKKHIAIDVILSSPAKRAKTTAEYFADEYDIKKKHIILVPGLYMASHDAFVKAIREAPEDAKSIAVFSHNDGITQFASTLSETRINHMPTCSVFAVNLDIQNWSDFQPGQAKFYFFDYPKSL